MFCNSRILLCSLASGKQLSGRHVFAFACLTPLAFNSCCNVMHASMSIQAYSRKCTNVHAYVQCCLAGKFTAKPGAYQRPPSAVHGASSLLTRTTRGGGMGELPPSTPGSNGRPISALPSGVPCLSFLLLVRFYLLIGCLSFLSLGASVFLLDEMMTSPTYVRYICFFLEDG